MKKEPSEKPSRTVFAAALTILVFAIASFAAILLIDAQKVSTLENDTAWLESQFTRNTSIELSESQKDIIHNSAAIVSNVAQDAGVTVNLKALCGNVYNTYFKVDVMLSDGINAGEGWCSFEECRLNGMGSDGMRTQTLEDDNSKDNGYSLLLKTGLQYYPGCDYAFDNGMVRTLHLENIRIQDESGQQSKLIEGEWEFEILFYDEGKVVDLIQEPAVVRGFDWWDKTYFEAEITSFALTEFSVHCQYEMMPNSQDSKMRLSPVVIMKDGTTVPTGSSGGGGQNYDWELTVPVSLNEVAFVKLTDNVVLPMQ